MDLWTDVTTCNRQVTGTPTWFTRMGAIVGLVVRRRLGLVEGVAPALDLGNDVSRRMRLFEVKGD
jgi:hypothetical protein